MKPRSLALWLAFLAVHLLVSWQGWVYPSQPMGDVVHVYEPWSSAALSGGAIVGITEPWVYPQVALLPMLAVKIIAAPFVALWGATDAYLVAWAFFVTVIDLLAFGMLVGRGGSGPRRTAGWFWIIALLLLGPIALYRIDAVTVPLAVVGGLWLIKRPAVGAALVTIGAWIKIWPGALALAAVVASTKRWAVLVSAAVTAAGIVVVLFLLGAEENVFGFLTEQTGRGLQVEAVAATPFLWLARAGVASIGYSSEMLTFQIYGSGVDVLSTILTPIMALVVLAATATGAVKAYRGASFPRLFPPLLLALVAALIVTNKVGSPQFQTWLLAPVVLWIVLDRTRAALPAVIVLLLCGLTCLVYPLTYNALLRAELGPVLLLSARNILLVVLLVISLRAVLRVPAHRGAVSSRAERA